jgi:hypothetical protein
MAYRRVIQLSPTTKVISLPSTWLSKNKVKKGDYVNVDEIENSIIIEKIKSDSPIISSDLRDLNDDLLWTAIDSFYILGYSDMQLNVTESQKKLLAKIVRFFPMFVIASETKASVELKAIATGLDIDFDKTLQHIRYMTNNIVDEALGMISIKDWDSLAKIKKLDYALNTDVSICFRELNIGHMKNVVAWSQYVKLLEMYADRLCMLFKIISKSRAISKNDILIIKKIQALYDDLFRLLNKFDIKGANAHAMESNSLESLFDKSVLHDPFYELTRSIFDMREIIFQLKRLYT